MISRRSFSFVGPLVFLPVALRAEPFFLKLEEMENSAVARSGRLSSAHAEVEAAEKKTAAVRSRQWPSLAVEGNYRHQSEIPEMSVAPSGPKVPMGDHPNYSFGPSVQWLVYDGGARKSQERAFTSLLGAREAEEVATAKSVRYSLRLAYLSVLGAAERTRLLMEALKLARSQSLDVQRRFLAGSASRQEELHADAERLARYRQWRDSQTQLAVTLEDLFQQAGWPERDLARPLPVDMVPFLKEAPAPTFVFETDTVSEIRRRWMGVLDQPWSVNSPETKTLTLAAEAARDQAAAIRAGHGPSLSLSGRWSRDYPNGPIRETINQTVGGASLRWSLFEGGRLLREAEEQNALARGVDERRRQITQGQENRWRQARVRWVGLVEEESIGDEMVRQRTELARLVYESYRAGRVSFLEVESANSALLQARILQAQTSIDGLRQLAVMWEVISVEGL